MKKIVSLLLAVLMVASAEGFNKRVIINANGGHNTAGAGFLVADAGGSVLVPDPIRAGYTFAGWTSTNDYSATLCLMQSIVPGKAFHEEIVFDGSTYYDLGRTYMYTDRLTLNLWAYMDNWADYEGRRMISCTEGGGIGFEPSGASTKHINFKGHDGAGYKDAKSTSTLSYAELAAGWHMFTLTFDGHNIKGFVDGELVAIGQHFTSDSLYYNATNSILLGAEPATGNSPAGTPCYFIGKMRDVSIVRSALSVSGVKMLYSQTKNLNDSNSKVSRYVMPANNKTLKASWKANAASTLTIDAAGGENTMSENTYTQPAGTPLTITNPRREGYTFTHWDKATSQYLSNYQGIPCSSPEAVTFDSTYYALGRDYMYEDVITINAWAYMDNWADYATAGMRIFSCTQSGGWNIEPNSAGQIQYVIRDSGIGYKTFAIPMLWSELKAGWHMFTLTFDGSRAHGYVDGVLMGSSKLFESGKIGYHASNGILIGAEPGEENKAVGSYFKGQIKNLAIMHTAILPDEVALLYANPGIVRHHFPTAAHTLTAVWKESTDVPAVSLSVSLHALSFETTEGTAAADRTLTVTAANLTGDITATLSGKNAGSFAVNPGSLGINGGTITVSYTETAVGSHTATLTLASAGATAQVITLTGVVNAKTVEPEPVSPIVSNKASIVLEGTYGAADAPFEDVIITATGLTSEMIINPSSSSIIATPLADWDALTGGTLRLSLNTTFVLGAGKYDSYVAIQSGTDIRIQITTKAILNPASSDPETPSYDFDATPTLTKVWETANVLASTDARYGTGYNGKVYAVDATNKVLYSWDAEGCTKTEVKTGIGGGWACTVDEAGNLLTNTGKWTSSFTDWQIYDIDAATQTALTISVPSGVTTGYIYANVAVAGDVTSDAGGTMYLAPAGQKVAAKVVLQNSAILSAEAAATSTTAFTNEDQLAIANVDYSALTNESFIWRNRGGKTNYILGGIESTHAEPVGETTNTGFATFMLNNVEYGVCPTGTYAADGFSVYQLLDGEVVGARTESKVGADQHASFRAEKVSEGEVNIYFYKAGVSCGMYKFAYPTTGTGGGVATDIESANQTTFGYYTAGQILYVTGVVAKNITLYNISGQKVCDIRNSNALDLNVGIGVYLVHVTDVQGIVHIAKLFVQ